jgi:hypothetical protein
MLSRVQREKGRAGYLLLQFQKQREIYVLSILLRMLQLQWRKLQFMPLMVGSG